MDTVRSTSTKLTPALYLGLVQFVFVSTWTVYAIFLPGLLASVGIDKRWTAWILMADQILFVMFDVAAGFAADRVHRLYGRTAPWLIGATAISCVSFLLLPALSATDGASWRAPLFLSLTCIWAVTSSALRAPAFTLISRYAAKPQRASITGLSLAGMALAGAVAPYLGASLRQLDPRVPFAVSSLSLMALAAGLIWAESASGRQTNSPSDATSAQPSIRPALLFPLIAIAALGYQIIFNLDAAPRYLRDAHADDLIWLMPIFWIGFNGSAAMAGWITKRVGARRLFIGACWVGAFGAATAMYLPGLSAATGGQLIAGGAWGFALVAAFGLVSEFASNVSTARPATLNGLLFSMLALATFTRIGINTLGLPQQAQSTGVFVSAPVVIWILVAVIASLANPDSRKTHSS